MVTILAFLFVFSIVVTFHELGHYWAGKIFRVKVETFSLGFGKTLFSTRDRAGTVWRVAAIPLGGYVRFFGDASAASNPDAAQLRALKEKIEAEHGPEAVAGCYHFKPVWQRAIIASAGPLANFILALAIFTMTIGVSGERGLAPLVARIVPESPAAEAGFEQGDLITAINGRPVRYFSEVQSFAALSAGEAATFTVERGGELVDLDVTIGRQVRPDGLGGESNLGYVGLAAGVRPIFASPTPGSPAEAAGVEDGDLLVEAGGRPIAFFQDLQEVLEEAQPGPLELVVMRDGARVELTATLEARRVDASASADGAPPAEYAYLGWRGSEDALLIDRYGPIGALTRGAAWTWQAAALPARYVGRIFQGKESGAELGGPARMAKTAGEIASGAMESAEGGGPLAAVGSAVFQLLLLAGALSVAIGMINLLPIPVLDGGHLVYYAYEAVAGRPLGEGAQEWGFRIGLAAVMGLMVFAFWNDLRYLGVFEAIGRLFS